MYGSNIRNHTGAVLRDPPLVNGWPVTAVCVTRTISTLLPERTCGRRAQLREVMGENETQLADILPPSTLVTRPPAPTTLVRIQHPLTTSFLGGRPPWRFE